MQKYNFHFSWIFILLCASACNSLAPMEAEKLASLSFLFESGISIPTFISVNDQETGELIEVFNPQSDITHTVNVPEALQAPAYMLSFYHHNRSPFLDKEAEVISFANFNQAIFSRTKPEPSTPGGYKMLTFKADSKIEGLFNERGFYRKIADDGLSMEIEVHASPTILFIKLVDETKYRYLVMEDPLSLASNEIEITSLPKVKKMREIIWESPMEAGQILIFALFKNGGMSGRIFDSHQSSFKTDNSFSIPDISGDFDFYTGFGYQIDGLGIGGQVTVEGIPQKLQIPEGVSTVSNSELGQFKQKIENAEIIGNTFSGENHNWHVLYPASAVGKWVKPEIPQIVLDSLSALSKTESLVSTNLINFQPGKEGQYEELAFGLKNQIQYFYSINIRAFPWGPFDKDVLVKTKLIKQ